MNILTRIGLWLGSVLLSVAIFSLLFSMVLNAWGALLVVSRVTMTFALPVWCLYLPMVVIVKDAEARRGQLILLSATLGGPAAVMLWCVLLQLRGGDPETVWNGDPLIGIGGIAAAIFALIVGFLTSTFYVAFLKILHHVPRRNTVQHDGAQLLG